ncbi:hypothetical protein BU15DRAFT_68520 [Melanogaster broomeanus]|nr:hypothetical protein BU15DRAFT_68520 [Melanogaster broomeanus]
MPYEVEFENGTGFRVDDLAFDGSNWTTYREELIYVAKLEGVVGQFDGTDAPPVAGTEAYQEWSFRNSAATMLVTFTIPDSLLINFYDTKIAQEIFTQLENRFSKSTTPSPTLSTPTRESRQKRDMLNRERRRKVERDRERSGEDQPTDRSVEKRNRRGKRAAERTGEGEAAARRPGEEALDVATASVSLTVKLSSQKIDDDGDVEVHCTSVVPQNLNATRQAASNTAADPATSNTKHARPTEPVGGSPEPQDELHEGAAAAAGPVEGAADLSAGSISLTPSSSQKNDGSGDVEVHCTSVMSQQPPANNRSAGEAAADVANPNATSAGPTGPAGAPCRPAEGQPPSMPLEGGRDASGQVTSGHAEHPEQGAHKPSMHTNPQHNVNAGVRDYARTEQQDGVQSEGEWKREVEEDLPEVPTPRPNSPAPHARKTLQPERVHGSPNAIEVEPGSTNVDDVNGTYARQQCTPWQCNRQRQQQQRPWKRPRRRRRRSQHATAAPRSHGTNSATTGNTNGTCGAQRHSANARGEEDHARAKRPQQRSVNVHGESPHAWGEWHISRATRGTSRNAKRPKQPTKRTNPPRRRGRLKVQSDSSLGASDMDQRCWGSILVPSGSNMKNSEPSLLLKDRAPPIALCKTPRDLPNREIGQA